MRDRDGQQLAYVHFDNPRAAARPLSRDEAPRSGFSFLWTRLFWRSNLLSAVWNVLSRRFPSSDRPSEPHMQSDWLVALLRHKEVVAGLR